MPCVEVTRHENQKKNEKENKKMKKITYDNGRAI